ncbi:MAG: S-methyl-5-thioribose-1-phosphate isomerase [Candidatus Aenigmatarchaeota archaeon]
MDSCSLVRKIKKLEIQGAKNVALAGLKALELYSKSVKTNDRALFFSKLGKMAKSISKARPTEPALRNVLNATLLKTIEGRTVNDMKKTLHNETASLSRSMNAAANRIAEIGAGKIHNGFVIFTHCHSNTVMGVLKRAKLSGKKFSVIFAETRPLFQGRLTAKDLSRMRIPATMIIDSAARMFMKNCDMVMFGADAVTANGAVINKIGSGLIALAAKERNVPVYVAVDSNKMDPATLDGSGEPMEERPPREISNRINGIKIRNPAFDIVPPEYISGIITEMGVIRPSTVRNFMEKKFSGARMQ